MTSRSVFFLAVTQLGDGSRRTVDLPLDRTDMDSWHPQLRGWSIGPATEERWIQIEEPSLLGTHLGIFGASNHVFLWGHVPPGHRLPAFAVGENATWRRLWGIEPENGHFSLRIDQRPLRIGDDVIQFLYDL